MLRKRKGQKYYAGCSSAYLMWYITSRMSWLSQQNERIVTQAVWDSCLTCAICQHMHAS